MTNNRAATLHRTFTRKGLTLSVAESCTGGLLCHMLTAIPGASAFFSAGVVAYSAAAKKRLLRIPQKVLAAHGMVSAETSALMAQQVRELNHTDYGVSTTGNLGPEVIEGKAKGLVYISVCSGRGTITRACRFRGSREEIKIRAATKAISMLVREARNA